jgi:hypothetical protein
LACARLQRRAGRGWENLRHRGRLLLLLALLAQLGELLVVEHPARAHAEHLADADHAGIEIDAIERLRPTSAGRLDADLDPARPGRRFAGARHARQRVFHVDERPRVRLEHFRRHRRDLAGAHQHVELALGDDADLLGLVAIGERADEHALLGDHFEDLRRRHAIAGIGQDLEEILEEGGFHHLALALLDIAAEHVISAGADRLHQQAALG